MRRLSAVALILFLFAGVAYSAKGPALSAEQIMSQVISTYGSCNSYLDEGEVRTVFLEPRGNRTVVKPFATAFVRPSDFRFEFKSRRGEEDWERYIVWRSAEAVKTWWSIDPGVKATEDLPMALAGATGVSGGSAAAVPSLLLPELAGMRYETLKELRLDGEEKVNGYDAYKIMGKDWRGEDLILWVDKESLLIVQIYEEAKFPSFETKTTRIYKPQVNVEIAREKLQFNAPEKMEN
jgi:outer membrane lipoprotein-sorting protein